MIKYISLLRGINVGGRNIRMTELTNCYSSIGLSNISTYLQSGNVTFYSKEDDIEELRIKLEFAVSIWFNYPAKVFVLNEDKMKLILEKYPFKTENDLYQYYVIFTDGELNIDLYEQGSHLITKLENISLGEGVVYWRVLKGMTVKSPFSKLLLKTQFKDFHTNRNINTLLKLLA